MNDLFNLFFGPLGMKYCNIFFIYTAFSLFSLFLVIGMTILSVFKKKFNWSLIAILITYTLIYFQNRVLYSMCTKKMVEGMYDIERG